jgi:single-stranded-DNA-specific exonuclease
LRLLLSTREDDAILLAAELEGLNTQRQRLTQEVVERARATVLERDEIDPVILIGGEGFPAGIVGLAAGRIAEEFNRPTIVYEERDGHVRASARSIPGFDVTAALATCSDLLSGHGGHHQAAGFSAPVENINELRERLIAIAGELLSQEDLEPSMRIDVEAAPSTLPGEVMELLKRMTPFGAQNVSPVYVGRGLEIRALRTMGAGNEHLRMTLREPERRVTWDTVAWRQGDRASDPLGGRVDIAYKLQTGGINTGFSRGALELEVLDLQPSSPAKA